MDSSKSPNSTPDETSEKEARAEQPTRRGSDLSLSRRIVMATLAGIGGLNVLTGSSQATRGGPQWQRDVDANGQKLFDLGAVVMQQNKTKIADFAGENLSIDDGHVLNATGARTNISENGSQVVQDTEDVNFASGLTATNTGSGTADVEIPIGGVDSDMIADGSVDLSKLGGIAAQADEIIKWNGSRWITTLDEDTHTDVSEDGTQVVEDTEDINFGSGLTATNTGSGGVDVDIPSGGVNNDMIADGSVDLSKLGGIAAAADEILRWNGSRWITSLDENTHTDVSEDGTQVVEDTEEINFGSGLSATNTGSGSADVKIPSGGVNSDMIADGTIKLGDLGDNDARAGEVIKWDGSSWITAPDIDTTSTRTAKTNIESVNSRQVLTGVEEMEVSTWEYQEENDNGQGIRHIGPMAEDFHDAVGVSDSEEHINSINADGVAFAAIQGLAERLERKDHRLAELESDFETEDSRLIDQRNRIERLESAVADKDERITDLKAENDALREQYESLEERIGELEEAIDNSPN